MHLQLFSLQGKSLAKFKLSKRRATHSWLAMACSCCDSKAVTLCQSCSLMPASTSHSARSTLIFSRPTSLQETTTRASYSGAYKGAYSVNAFCTASIPLVLVNQSVLVGQRHCWVRKYALDVALRFPAGPRLVHGTHAVP
jgi:hypothetical protein